MCIITPRALCIFELCIFFCCCLYNLFESCGRVWTETKKAVRKRQREKPCVHFSPMTKVWKLIMRTQPGPWPSAPFIWGEPQGLLSFWRVYRSGQCNMPSAITPATRTAGVTLHGPLQRYAVCTRESVSSEAVKRRRWKKKKAGAVSQYELGRLKVTKSTFFETSASKGCFFFP